MKSPSPKLMFLLLAALAYTLGTAVHLQAMRQSDPGRPDQGAFKKLLGDGRRLFAGQFVEMADVYFHSGFYPSIFDRIEKKPERAVTSAVEADGHDEHEGHAHDEHGNCAHGEGEDEHVKSMTPAGAQNWLETFIRKFRVTEHTHLSDGEEREILPWLKLAIELDPQAIDTYTTAAFWLRDLGKTESAEQVLREGIQNNPGNYELVFEMGRLLKQDRHDLNRARNLWRYSMQCWRNQSEAEQEASRTDFSRIASNLGELEQEAGNISEAVQYFEIARPYSPRPEGLQQRIDDLLKQSVSATNSPTARP